MGSTRWGLGDTIEEMKNVIYKCRTSPSPLILPAGRYRMIVTREVFDSTFSNVTGWVDPAERTITTENVEFEVVEACSGRDESQKNSSDPSACSLNASALSDAFNHSLTTRKLEMPPCYLQTEQNDPNLLKYQVRLGKDHNLLPAKDWVKKHVDNGDLTSPQEGGRFMLLGAVQVVGDTVRVTMRIIDVETAVVLFTSKGDGRGCPDGLQEAVETALAGLNFPLRPYAPRP
jgi:hypothetical protein